jgi:hypothetical protein
MTFGKPVAGNSICIVVSNVIRFVSLDGFQLVLPKIRTLVASLGKIACLSLLLSTLTIML